MELGLIATFAILIVACIIVAIDQQYQEPTSELGEEWDFTSPKSYKKS